MNQREFKRAVARTYDEPDMYLELLLDGKVVASIHEIQKAWNMTKKESVEEYLDFEYAGITEKSDKKQYLLSVGAIRIIFDDFNEHWI